MNKWQVLSKKEDIHIGMRITFQRTKYDTTRN